MTKTVEQLKADGRFFDAGVLAAQIGHARLYGCHYGMRSTLEASRVEFFEGYDREKARAAAKKAKARRPVHRNWLVLAQPRGECTVATMRVIDAWATHGHTSKAEQLKRLQAHRDEGLYSDDVQPGDRLILAEQGDWAMV